MRPAGIQVATEVSGRVVTARFRAVQGGRLELVDLAERSAIVPAPALRAYRFALPAGAAWYRTLRLPGGDVRSRGRILAFEVERAFPVAGADLIWDACRAPGADNGGAELVVGMRAEDAARRIACLGAVGVRPVTMEPPGGPLYRYFRYMEPEERRPGLLVDLLSSGAQVVFVAGGGWTLRAVSDAASIAGPSQVERIHLEVARLVSGLGRGSAPAWVRVCGEGSEAEALRHELARRLAIPAGLLDHTARGRLDGLPASLVSGELARALPVLIGLALAPASGERALDLLPRSIRRQQARQRRRPALIAASALVALSLGSLAVRAVQRAGEAGVRVARLRQELPARLDHRRELDASKERLRRLEERIGRAAQLVDARDAWIRFLADLQIAVDAAGEAWIDRLEREPGAEGAAGFAVAVHGRLLDADAPGGRVSEIARRRVKAMLVSLGASSSVSRISREHFRSGEPGVLQFELGVVLAMGESEAEAP